MRVRALSSVGDMQFGQGQRNFLRDVPEAVGQIVGTRLGEYTGDWFLDTSAGMPWRTRVLGRKTEATRDPAIRARILGTQGVLLINTYASQLNRQTRNLGVQVNIDTIYGATTVTTSPSPTDIDVRQGR